MSETRKNHNIDYVFARYPLWIRYSGLPKKLGPVCWCVFQRLLELNERFESDKFFYSMERMCETTGVSSRWNLKKNLDKLVEEKLIKYKTSAGRGKAAEFEIIKPLNTPIIEEDLYHVHPRLRSKSYKFKTHGSEKDTESALLEDERKGHGACPFKGAEKDTEHALLSAEKDTEHALLSAEKDTEHAPIKKIYIKRQQQKDLFSEIDDQKKSMDSTKNVEGNSVVAAFDENNLKNEVLRAVKVNGKMHYSPFK